MQDSGLVPRVRVTSASADRSFDALTDMADFRLDYEEGSLMEGVPNDATEKAVTRAVGEELRRVRDSIGWTRVELVDQMPSDIHARTYANYEGGTRPCSVARFVEICVTLGVEAPEVLELALQRAKIRLVELTLQVDLNAVINDTRAELQPLRRWAQNRLTANPDGPGIARLTTAVIYEMSAFLGFTRSELIGHLVQFTPQVTPRR